MTSSDALFDPRRFAAAIERLAERRATALTARSAAESGVSLSTIREKRHTFARLLAKDLLSGRLDAAPGRIYHVEKEGKERRLFDFPIVEWIIHDAVAEWLAEKTSPLLSPRLYSYQSGVSYRHALRDFASYVRRSSRAGRHVSERGVYVLRRDIRAYFDSIPVDAGAPLWTNLAQLIGPASPEDPAWTVIRRTLCPLLADSQGSLYRLDRGIPTGSPVANVVANLYLSELDNEMSRVAGAFYARYGDDVVAAHEDAESAARMGHLLAAHLEPKGLQFSDTKTRDLYLTIPGCAVRADIDAQPAIDVEFLGHRVSAHGTISLSLAKTRTLLSDLRTRASNAARVSARDTDERLSAAVQAINRLLDPLSAAAHPYAKLLRTTVTDRAYLKWLDHELALIVVGVAVGGRSARHFRRFSPVDLRHRFRLRSVVVARNRSGRQG